MYLGIHPLYHLEYYYPPMLILSNIYVEVWPGYIIGLQNVQSQTDCLNSVIGCPIYVNCIFFLLQT